jgi:hypothetical protein
LGARPDDAVSDAGISMISVVEPMSSLSGLGGNAPTFPLNSFLQRKSEKNAQIPENLYS